MKRIVFVVVLLSLGCAGYRVHPGAGGYISGAPTAVQTTASQWYDDLSATDAIIMKTRADFLTNKFPPAAMPTIRSAFNALVTAYDTAQQAWLAFNQAAASGSTATQASVAAAIAAMDSATQQLTAVKGGK